MTLEDSVLHGDSFLVWLLFSITQPVIHQRRVGAVQNLFVNGIVLGEKLTKVTDVIPVFSQSVILCSTLKRCLTQTQIQVN